ncbi:MAG TPA: hypothetical protein VGO52_00990, partial [Hyphomonadaceae bacterium]|nr:hypothetical protein [Hyphomonadaceae bacterium]
MILEIVYFLALGLIGLALLFPGIPRLGALLAAGCALPVGLSATALVQLLLAIVNFKLNAILIWALLAVEIAAAGAWLATTKPKAITAVWKPALILAAAIGLVAIVQATQHAAVLSFDSYDYLVIASNLYRADTALGSDAISGFLNNYAPLLWLAHAPARLFGQEFLALLHPLVFVSLLLTTCGLVETCTRDARVSRLIRIPAIAAPAIVLMTTPQILHHAVYVMPNLLTGLMFTAAIGFLWIAGTQPDSRRLIIPAAICLAAVTLARQEGGLMSAILLVMFSTTDKVNWLAKMALAGFVAAVSTVWYVTLISVTGPAADQAILTPIGAMLQIGCLWVAAAIAGASSIPSLNRSILLAAMSMPLILAFGHVAYFVIKPAHAIESMGVFAVNALWAPALWGIWWGVALPAGGLTL